MFSVQLLTATWKPYPKAASVSADTPAKGCSPWSTQPAAGLRKQEHSGVAVFHYSWVGVGTGTVHVPHPPSPCPVWSRGPAGSAVVTGGGWCTWMRGSNCSEKLREVTGAPAALSQHTGGSQTSLCSHFLTCQNDLA